MAEHVKSWAFRIKIPCGGKIKREDSPIITESFAYFNLPEIQAETEREAYVRLMARIPLKPGHVLEPNRERSRCIGSARWIIPKELNPKLKDLLKRMHHCWLADRLEDIVKFTGFSDPVIYKDNQGNYHEILLCEE